MVLPRDNETRPSVYSSYTLHTRGPRYQCDHELLAIHRCYTTLPIYTPPLVYYCILEVAKTLLNQLAKVNNIHMFGHQTHERYSLP